VRANLIADAGITEAQIAEVRKGMWNVVNDGGGTAGRARNENMCTAGKTGTAQFWRSGKKDNHTWFISFAPYDAPEYVVVTFVQGAKSGGGVSAPIAAKILKDISAYKNGEDVTLAALEPAKGNFLFTESMDFGREAPAANKLSEDAEVAENPSAEAQENRPPAAPSVREDADARGRVNNSAQPKPAPPKPATTPTPAPRNNPIQNIFNLISGKKAAVDGENQKPKPEKPKNR
jgi:penicillin-binding protein 2